MGEPARPPPLPNARELAEHVREELWFGDDDPARTHLQASKSLAATIARTTGLKPFPVAAQQTLVLLKDERAPVQKIVRAVEGDPGLAARVLSVANSALYSSGKPCANIEQAIVRLGLGKVSRIVMSLTLLGLFPALDQVAKLVRNHSIRVAAMARVLAAECRAAPPEDLFLCGLLHDVGKLLALQAGEVEYDRLGPEALSLPDETHVRERLVLGWDHAVLGAHVLAFWKLPSDVVRVVAWHHQPARAYAEGGPNRASVALVRLANALDYELRNTDELSEERAFELEQRGALEFTGVSRDVLCAMTPKLIEAAGALEQALRG